MDRIGFDALSEILADGAFSSISRIGRAHNLTVAGNGVFTFEHLNDNRAGGHKSNKIVEERPFFVNSIETLGLFAGHVDPLLANNAQTTFFEAGATLPVIFRRVASGLMIENVRSRAIEFSFVQAIYRKDHPRADRLINPPPVNDKP